MLPGVKPIQLGPLPGRVSETPDQSNVDDIGKAVRESYKDTEPLDLTKKEKPPKY